MELDPPSWRALIVFSCRSCHEMHKFPQQKPYCVPKVRMTTQLRKQILRLIMIRIT